MIPTRPAQTAPKKFPADQRGARPAAEAQPHPAQQAFLEHSRVRIERHLVTVAQCAGFACEPRQLLPGKMLRTRLGARLHAAGCLPVPGQTLQDVCAAVELVHTASLCHDDVIDNALVRRGLPALWRVSSPSGAVLLGDLLLCEAMDILLETEGGRYVAPFVAKLRETCRAEAEQELKLRGRRPSEGACLRIARGKTGPLFAFVGLVAGGLRGEPAAALQEAGYCIGTAYQLADDLLDVEGREEQAGKTLGTDRDRMKYTLPQLPEVGSRSTRALVAQMCDCARQCVAAWPPLQSAVADFLNLDVEPVFRLCESPLHVQVGRVDEV